MKTKNFTSLGSLHPILFFAVVYVVALFFSIFICSSLFYSCNTSQAKISSQQQPTPANEKAINTSATMVAVR